ncbi:MAG: hypothetical protein HRT82_13280 [Henriciella sp.]|nr:hypothetical protein [Henriciella sp.]
MIKRMMAAMAVAGAVTSGWAIADEVWSTEIGDVIYEIDLENGMAVLSYPTDMEEIRGRAYVSGLAGVYTGRTGYEGIWIEPATEAGTCDVEMVAPDSGEASNNWGRIRVVLSIRTFRRPLSPCAATVSMSRARCWWRGP